MYPSDTEAAILRAAGNFMTIRMSTYDPSHDHHHVQRVRKTALALANSLPRKPDLFVVELAALLHDLLDKKYVTEQLSSDPLAFFLPFFESVKEHKDIITTGQAALVARIVDNVSWSTEKRLRAENKLTEWHETCIELHCVQDADRLDAIGAFGIMRCSAYSCIANRPLYVPSNDPIFDQSAVAHFYDKLLHIKDRLKTDPGMKLGAERHQLMQVFLAALHKEYNIGAVDES